LYSFSQQDIKMTTNTFDYIKYGKRILQDEADAIASMVMLLGEDFERSCQAVSDCGGRIVFAGVGQSAHVARKSAASMASLGKPAFYVHATEALHGDMGMITPEDVVILISHSGETKETLNMLSVLKNLSPKTIALTGNPESTLARNCDLVLATHIKQEAGTIQFAPTSSALATIALLDAILSAVAVGRGFSEKEYARFHPAGSLGKMLLGDKSL
jgi:arabinose-5-phosphate isomerase